MSWREGSLPTIFRLRGAPLAFATAAAQLAVSSTGSLLVFVALRAGFLAGFFLAAFFLAAFFFAGAIGWETIAAALFWCAAIAHRGRPLSRERITLIACGANLMLWAAFQVLDEVFLAYQPEGVHRMIFVNQLVTLVFLHLSADGQPASPWKPEA